MRSAEHFPFDHNACGNTFRPGSRCPNCAGLLLPESTKTAITALVVGF